MNAIQRILESLMPSPVKSAKKVIKKGAAGSVAGAIGGAGKMNPNNTKLGVARAQLQPKQPLPYILPGGVTSQFNPNSVTNAGNLTPRYEDGYDTTIKYLQGNMQRGRMPMDMDTVPTNFTAGRTGYFQGSNPFTNIPTRNVYNNIQPIDPDTYARGDMIQSPSFGAWQPRNRY